jgi:membrane protease YdiL (CAAX protease family)
LLALNLLFNLLVYMPMMLVLKRTVGLDLRPSLETGSFMFSAVALAPLIEELLFRAGLRSARWAAFGLPVVGALFCADGKIALSLAVLAAIVWLADRVHGRRLSAEALTRSRWKCGRLFIRNYALVVRIYAVSFALAHFSNFAVDAGAGWKSALILLAVTSQFMGGLVFSYLRLRHGLLSAMSAHFSWNAVAVGIAMLGG